MAKARQEEKLDIRFQCGVGDMYERRVKDMGEGYAVITATTDGQSISRPRNALRGVSITEDNKYIVVDGVRFEIFSPEPRWETSISAPEEWYDVDIWKCEKMEFDAAKTVLDIFSSMLNIGDVEVAEGYDGYPSTRYGRKIFIRRNTILASVQIVNNLLQTIADSIEYTYVEFYFQVSSLKNYRVTILGGTKSDTIKYSNYQGYNCRRSFLSDIVTDMFYYHTKEDLKTIIQASLDETVANIKNKESFSRLLVAEEELCLKDKEYYDIELYLNSKRRDKTHQVCIYTDTQGNISQKFITYPNDGLYLVKITPTNVFDLFSKRKDLINMIDDIIIKSIDSDFNNAFWQLCEQVLIDYNNKVCGIPVADPSNARKAPMSELCQNVWDKNQRKASSVPIADPNATRSYIFKLCGPVWNRD